MILMLFLFSIAFCPPAEGNDAGDEVNIQLLQDKNHLSTLLRDENFIFINEYVFNPLEGEPAFPVLEGYELTAHSYPLSEKHYYLLQYGGKITPPMFRTLRETGVRVLGYYPNNCYLVQAAKAQQRTLSALPQVRWLGDFHPVYKIDPPLLKGDTGFDKDGGKVRLHVMGFKHEKMEDLREKLLKTDTSAAIESLYDESNHRGWAILSVDRTAVNRVVASLSLLPEVQYINIQPELKVLNDDSVWLHQSGNDTTFAATCFDNGLTGFGEVYGTSDTGIDVDACQFRYSNDLSDLTIYNETQPPEVHITHPNNKIISYHVLTNSNPYGDAQAHGAATAGTAVGDNFAHLADATDPGRDENDGMAPGAKILFLDIGREVGVGVLMPPMFDMFRQAWNSGVRVHNNSWGPENQIAYRGLEILQTDEALWGEFWNLNVFFGAGNTGPNGRTLGGQVSKNAVQVGANMHYGDDDVNDLTNFSSHGPTADYRYKPDLVATGGKVWTADADAQSDPPNDTCNTYRTAGTSFSAPTAAGNAILAREYFLDGYYPSGAPVPADSFDPSNALIKGVLINGAQNGTGLRSGHHGTKPGSRPTFGQGWGRITLDETLFFPGDTRNLAVLADIKNGATAPDPDRPALYPTITTGDTHTYNVSVSHAASQEPLLITLNWSDPAGTPAWHPVLVNDLDLVVMDPLGREYTGNIYIKNGFSFPDSGFPSDNLNNNENVFIEHAVAGTYTIHVIGTNVPGNGETEPYDSNLQGYALVAAGGFSTEAGPRPEFQTIEIVGGRDNDQFMDIEETVAIGIQVINTGMMNAAGVTCTLSVDPSSDIPASSVDIPTPTRSYGHLAPGETAARAFPATLLNNLSDYCNRTITFNAQVTDDGISVVNTTFIVEVAKNLVERPLVNFENGLSGWILLKRDNGDNPGPDPAPGIVDCDESDRPTPRYALKFGPRDCTTEYSHDVNLIARFDHVEVPEEDEIYSLKFWHRYRTQEGRDWCQIFLRVPNRSLIKEYQGPFGTIMEEMVQEEVDISFFQQERGEGATEIGIEFHLRTNGGGSTPLGWIIDDISLVVKACDLSDAGSLAPALTAAHPNVVPPGTPYTYVEIIGTDFVNGASVSSSDAGITIHGTRFNSDTSLTAIISTDTTASGPVSLTVTNPDSQSGTGNNILNIALAGGVILTGPGAGPNNQTPPHARVWSLDAVKLLDFTAYTDFDTHGLNITAGDIDGDSQEEIITGPGPAETNPPEVRAFETNGEQNDDILFLAYGVSKNGVNPAAGDVTGDGIAEIITGPGPGAVFGPHVRGWSINASQGMSIPTISYLAYGTKKWGVNVATGDIDGDGYAEIITGAGPGYVFGPHVRGWNVDNDFVTPINNFSYFAYNTRHWGVHVATGNMDGEPRDEILSAPGPGPIFGPQIRGWNFENNVITSIHPINFFAYDTRKYGANVAAGDLDGDGFDEIVTGPGPGGGLGPWVRVWDYDNGQVGPFIRNFKAYDQGKFGVKVSTASAFGY